ncbi:MAG: hypothetical protein WC055_01880 [Melioribacteraceae bacterium]
MNEPEKKMLKSLNDFMKDYGIESISFGKSHSLKKTRGKKAKPINKSTNDKENSSSK